MILELNSESFNWMEGSPFQVPVENSILEVVKWKARVRQRSKGKCTALTTCGYIFGRNSPATNRIACVGCSVEHRGLAGLGRNAKDLIHFRTRQM